MSASEASTTQGELEKLVSDLRGLLANKDLDTVPEIKLLRQRLDDGIHSARESAIRAAQDAARRSQGCSAGGRPLCPRRALARCQPQRWQWAPWWAFLLARR